MQTTGHHTEAASEAAAVDPPHQRHSRRSWMWAMGLGVGVSAAAVLIGTYELTIGLAAIVLFPLLWAVLIGAVVGLQPWRPVTGPTRAVSELLIRVGIVVFLALLGTGIGPSLPDLVDIGPAIALQELGNAFGTVIIGIPVAVAMGMGRVAIGATWSANRESYLAYAIDKWGVRAPEYQGVFGVWLLGTVFGAAFISLIAGITGGLEIFDPRALALACGLGSASMMLGGAGSLTVLYPEMAGEIMALAAISNLVTNIVGFYMGVYVVLPFARWFYRVWVKILRKEETDARSIAADPVPVAEEGSARTKKPQDPPPPKTIAAWVAAFIFTGVAGLLINWQGTGELSLTGIIGITMVTGLSVLAFLLARVVRAVPASIWVLAMATLASAPFFPGSEFLVGMTENLDVLLVGLPQIALLGLSLGRDIDGLKRMSWKVVLIGFLTLASAYLAAAVVAQLVLPGV
ncbi:DUF3100 domain-containing protein [Nesterenkonia xinjiangensis]|uniref:DUF3100 domain-containing protein n=1 Tax=Nesterenkonia xinjiangensis TaxID=225327 RepID=A0A7Z0GL49_9MICC|nr:DUF3100 domain-containing protein [Nesterenkonia xinjiangensis]NYJ77935.1 hypothetical protein [Nesterenkonia xinjiangensis]